ncbi:hypothetical protein DWY76_10080 [Faecalibacterium sp. AF27-11BH]|nr:hypothetical protein DWY76_10080 [Faecalibacterium sp. AF27-11BH]
MASAALWPSSVELLFLFAVPKRLRAFRNCFFTKGLVTSSGQPIHSAAVSVGNRRCRCRFPLRPLW